MAPRFNVWMIAAIGKNRKAAWQSRCAHVTVTESRLMQRYALIYTSRRFSTHRCPQLIAVLRRLSDVLQGRVWHTSPKESEASPL